MNSKYLILLKIVFWIIILGTLLSIPFILLLNLKSYIPLWLIQSNKVFSERIYSSGLSLVFSIIGFLVAAIIFLMQFIASRYHTEELDSMPMFKKYFITTLFMFFVIIIFNLWALYSKLIYPYTLISLILSLSVLLLILTTIFFVFFNLKVSVILGMLSNQISKFISKKKEFKTITVFGDISYSDEFINNLKNKVSIFIKNSINAVKNNQDVIFKNSLESIRKICHEYLEQSQHIQATEDKFLSDLNDQFNFIISESLKSYNQKILEDVAETIGKISLDIIRYRKGIAEVNNFALVWVATLKDLFIKSYNKDRTIVCRICLRRINDIILLVLDKGFHRSYNTYKSFLDEISEFLTKINQYWSAVLLQEALLLYQYQFLKFLELLKNNKIIFSGFFIKQYFDKLIELINNSKNIHNSFTNKAVIFASLWGIFPFSQRIAKSGLINLQNNKIKKGLSMYMQYFINFNNEIIKNNPEKNDIDIYNSFSETLFLINKYIDLINEDEEFLIDLLSNNLLDSIKSRYLKALDKDYNKLYETRELTINYFALLIYLYNNNSKLISKVIKHLMDIYKIIKRKSISSNKKHIAGSLYIELKLYSCWINNFPNLKKINKPFIELLKKDFFEPTFPGRRSIPSLFEKYGYPRDRMSSLNGLWYLHPSHMWGNIFQEEISNKLNGEKGETYIKFNEILKNKK